MLYYGIYNSYNNIKLNRAAVVLTLPIQGGQFTAALLCIWAKNVILLGIMGNYA